MSKKITFLLICFLLFITIEYRLSDIKENKVAVNLSYSTEEASPKEMSKVSLSKQNNSPSGEESQIFMTLKQETYPISTDKIDVIIKNNTLEDYYTDKKYYIEYFNGSVWSKIPLDIIVNYDRVMIPSGKFIELSIYLLSEQYHYEPGKYRICKTVYSSANISIITSEFNLK